MNGWDGDYDGWILHVTILSPFWCLNPLKNHHVLPFKHPIYSWISHEKTYIYRRFSMIFLFQLNFSSANSTKFPKTQARSFRRHLAGLRWRWNHGVESDDGRRSRHSALNLRKFRMDLYMRYMIIYPSLYIYSVSYIIYIINDWGWLSPLDFALRNLTRTNLLLQPNATRAVLAPLTRAASRCPIQVFHHLWRAPTDFNTDHGRVNI